MTDEERGRYVASELKLCVIQVSGIWTIIFHSGTRWDMIKDFYVEPYKPLKCLAGWDTEEQLYTALGAAILKYREFLAIMLVDG